MKKVGLVLLGLVLTIAGCGSLTQSDCLNNQKFLHEGRCKAWEDIPYEDQDNVLLEVADAIAEKQEISREDALEIMHRILVEGEDF